MKYIFVDTNALVALGNRNDQFHNQAIEIFNELFTEGVLFITTNHVFDETITILLKRVGHFAAVDFGEKLHGSSFFYLFHVDEKLEKEAWELFKKYSDKDFSFTDCTSFLVMKLFNLEKAFTHDHHFNQMGFEILL